MRIRYSYQNEEFNEITKPIISETVYQGMMQITHHGVTRYDHCLRVAFYTYYVTKLLHLNYYEATRGALLHDFFYNQEGKRKKEMLVSHPKYAVEMAKEHFEISKMEEDIILSHMFPVVLRLPRYLESWIVDFVDDWAGIYEKVYSVRKQFSHVCSFIFLFILVFLSK